ncbi:MAG: hypothetical protein K1X64_18055 [Myxococcaceae bacterium]|nr:hypothetical protein [Myxococcaceae bacterium]
MQAADPKNAWALAHGVTALGKNYAAADGRKATDVMVSDFLLQNAAPDGGTVTGARYGFVRYTADGTPVEPHTNLMTKTLVLAKVPLTQSFKTSFGKVTLAELVDSMKRGFHHVPTNEDYWRDVGWTLDALAQTLKPGPGAVFTNAEGQRVDFNEVMNDALAYLERATADLKAGMAQGLPQVDKRKQGLYAHSCGGLHLVQAVFSWARYPAVKKAWGTRFDDQVAILFYRLESERRQYDEALEKVPTHKLEIGVQMLKFYGHFLETTGRLKNERTWQPTPAQQISVNRAKALLDHATRQLEDMRAFETMGELKTSKKQVYLDLIGDTCHASHGWDYWP